MSGLFGRYKFLHSREVIMMSELLKGNFKVQREIKVDETKDEAAEFKKEFRKKALESIGGSMVFVEREKLFWDESNLNEKSLQKS